MNIPDILWEWGEMSQCWPWRNEGPDLPTEGQKSAGISIVERLGLETFGRAASNDNSVPPTPLPK